MDGGSKMAISVLLIFCIIISDQISKHCARQKLSNRTSQKGVFHLKLVYNKGAFRGLLKERPVLLALIQGIAVFSVFIVWLICVFIKKERGMVFGLSCILGGAIGNFIDRVHEGKVTDFFAIKWTKNLYYNVADWFIFLGGVWVLILEIKGYVTRS